MNLRAVHAVLILLSAALAALFGVWCLGLTGGEANPLAAGVAFVVAVALILYDSWFLRKTKTL